MSTGKTNPAWQILESARTLPRIAAAHGITLGDGFTLLTYVLGLKCHGQKSKKNGFRHPRTVAMGEGTLCYEMGDKKVDSLRNLKKKLWREHCITFVEKKGYQGHPSVYHIHEHEQFDSLMRYDAAARDFWDGNPDLHTDLRQIMRLQPPKDESKAKAFPGLLAWTRYAEEIDLRAARYIERGGKVNAYLQPFADLARAAGLSVDRGTDKREVTFAFTQGEEVAPTWEPPEAWEPPTAEDTQDETEACWPSFEPRTAARPYEYADPPF